MYDEFIQEKGYTEESCKCIEETVDKLLRNRTSVNHPGMLFGKIQSGKTRTFIGIIALAFDKAYDVCVIFTKNSIALLN